jgi:hypothetical protein
MTNLALADRSGAPMHLVDLARQISARGIRVSAYAFELGETADLLRHAGIEVVDHPGQLSSPPDLIHGHHNIALMSALQSFRDAPALLVCHDASSWHDRAPRHPRIVEYVGDDRLCRERIARDLGRPIEDVRFIVNGVDLTRFARVRGHWPEAPRTALIFSNYASPRGYNRFVAEACRRLGIRLDTRGAGVDRPLTHPERHLPEFDLVFAKARCAMEAMVCGCAVILCDVRGLGELVTPESFVGEWEALYRAILNRPRPQTDADAEARGVIELLGNLAEAMSELNQVEALHERILDLKRVAGKRCKHAWQFWRERR